jgi:hypothetical protein
MSFTYWSMDGYIRLGWSSPLLCLLNVILETKLPPQLVVVVTPFLHIPLEHSLCCNFRNSDLNCSKGNCGEFTFQHNSIAIGEPTTLSHRQCSSFNSNPMKHWREESAYHYKPWVSLGKELQPFETVSGGSETNTVKLSLLWDIGLWGFEAPTFCLDIRFTDGGNVVSVTHRPPFTLKKIPGTHFCERLSRPQDHSAVGRIKSTEKSNDLIGNRTGTLLACSIVPQPTTLPHAPSILSIVSSIIWNLSITFIKPIFCYLVPNICFVVTALCMFSQTIYKFADGTRYKKQYIT